MMRSFAVLVLLSVTATAAEVDVLMPAHGEQITFVNVKKLATSPLFKTMLQKEIEEKLKATEVPKWLKDMGVDLWKDIDSLSLSVTPPKIDRKDPPKPGKYPQAKTFLTVRGTFNGGKIFDAAEKAVEKFGDKLSMVKDGDVKMLKIVMPGDSVAYVTMADEKTIVIATEKEDLLKSLKTADDPAARPAVKKELLALIETLDKNAAFYQAMLLNGEEVAEGISANPLFEDTELLKKQVAEITCYSIVARVGRDVTFEFAVGMKNTEAAAAFGETGKAIVEKGRTLLPLVSASQKQLAGAVNDLSKSMKITVVKENVILSGKITGTSIQQAFEIETD